MSDSISTLRLIFELDPNASPVNALSPATIGTRPLIYCGTTHVGQHSLRLWKLTFDQWLDAIRQKVVLTSPACAS